MSRPTQSQNLFVRTSGLVLSLFFILNLCADFSQAADLNRMPTTSASASFDQAIYGSTLAKCQKTLSNGSASRLASIWQGFDFQVAKSSAAEGLMVLGLDTQAITSTIQNKGLSSLLAATLASPGFQAALDQCYGEDLLSRKTYIAGLIASEVVGRAVVAGVTVAGGYVAGRILGALYSLAPRLTAVVVLGSTIGTASQTYASIRSEFGTRTKKEEDQARARCLETVRPQIEMTEKNQSFLNQQIRQLQLRTIIMTDELEVQKKLAALKRLSQLRDKVTQDIADLAKCSPVKE